MRIAEVIGTVTLSHWHPSMGGAQYKLAVPLSWDNLLKRSDDLLEEVVVYDELGAGTGCLIALSEGREAAMPFYPDVKPVDVYNAAILDNLHVRLPSDLQEDAG